VAEDQDKASGLSNTRDNKGIGFGVFLLLAGIALLGERSGWFPSQTDWFFPAILIAWGAGEIFRRIE
jgi:hypothetical protein